MKQRLAILVILASILTPSAFAQSMEPVFHGAQRDWRVFTRGEGAERICYVQSTPRDSNPQNTDHGDVFFLVASWANGDAREQPSFLAGQMLRPDSPPRLRVGSDSYRMFVSEREGFVEDPSEELCHARGGDAFRRHACHLRVLALRGDRRLAAGRASLPLAARLDAARLLRKTAQPWRPSLKTAAPEPG